MSDAVTSSAIRWDTLAKKGQIYQKQAHIATLKG